MDCAMKYLSHSDKVLFNWLFSLTAQRNCTMLKWISSSGDGYLYALIALLVWFFEPEHGKIFVYSALLAYAMELPLYIALKNAFKRQRPFEFPFNTQAHLTPADKFSLPSGHTAAAFLMATLLAYYFPSLLLIVYVWAIFVGCSRILLGVHYPSDIVAGGLLGWAIAKLSITMM